MRMPGDIGPFHILGIGGIGMSAIAEVLVDLGYTVQGSDQKESANVRRLRQKGIRVFIGHDPINLIGARYVVISTAVKDGNPELEGARQRRLPIINRAAMLAELMRLTKTVSVTGTHGKTTTTSMIAHLFKTADLDPTVITGGIINDWGTNARVGKGDWMVVEADKSDGTHARLPTQIGVVTNIDPEHLDYYGTVEKMEEAYRLFFDQIPFYGLAVAGIDHPVVRRMLGEMRVRENSRRVLSFGAAEDADIRLHNVRHEGHTTKFDVDLSARVSGGARTFTNVMLGVPGHYNVLNALAAIAVATEAGIDDTVIIKGLSTFAGVKRRFEPTGTWNGVSIYDDYAHHPAEVASVLKAARAATDGRVIAVFQPHRYYARARPVRRVLRLVQRRRRRAGDADLHGRRTADRRHHARGRRPGHPPSRPSRRHAGRERARAGAGPEPVRQARRSRHLPRRRHDHGLGARAAGVAEWQPLPFDERRRKRARERQETSQNTLTPVHTFDALRAPLLVSASSAPQLHLPRRGGRREAPGGR